MKFRLLTPVFCLLMLLGVSASPRLLAADLSIYKAGEIQAEAIAFTESDNLNDYDSGGGIGLTYWHFAQAGLGFEGKTLDARHALLDTIGLNLAGRFPVEKLNAALVTRIGFDWHAEQVNNTRANDFDVYVGLGAEKRFKGYTIGAELRGVRAAELAPDEKLQLLVRVGRAF